MRTFDIRLAIPPDLQLPLPDFFYNRQDYLSLSDTSSVVSFFLLPLGSEEIVARLHVNCVNGLAKSHWRAPFGFLETFIREEDLLGLFWKRIETELKVLGIRKVELVSWPSFYMDSSKALWNILEKQGFKKAYENHNYHLLVDERPALSHFLKPERKRLRKCLRENIVVELKRESDGFKVHQLLQDFRDQKSIPLNISAGALDQGFKRFPERYVVFYVKQGTQTIALSVCVEVNNAIFYHFCLACDKRFNSLSPSVLLYAAIYEHCQKQGYKWFDFGVASVQGQVQEGLAQFKKNLGGQLSLKPTYLKELA